VIPGATGRLLERPLDCRCVQRRSVAEAGLAAQSEKERPAAVCDVPPLGELRDRVALLVGGDERLEDVAQHLDLVIESRVGRVRNRHRDRRRHRQVASAVPAGALGRRAAHPVGLRQQPLGDGVLSAQAGEVGGQREAAPEQLRLAERAAERDPLLGPASRLLDPPTLPRRLRGLDHRLERLALAAGPFPEVHGARQLGQGRLGAAREPGGARQQVVRRRLAGRVGPGLVGEEVEHPPGSQRGIVGRRGGERATAGEKAV
jgi:hypothetical protein